MSEKPFLEDDNGWKAEDHSVDCDSFFRRTTSNLKYWFRCDCDCKEEV